MDEVMELPSDPNFEDPCAKKAVEFYEKEVAANTWDHIDSVIEVYDKMKQGKWSWILSKDCKYIDVRIDMRSGHCLIYDNNGNRISPEDLAAQYSRT